MSDREWSHCCDEFCPASNLWEERGWGLQWRGGKETQRGEGSEGQGLVPQPLFWPFDGCWMGKDPPGAVGVDALCKDSGEAGVRGGTRGAGGGQGFPPQPHASRIWSGRGSCGAGALRLWEHPGDGGSGNWRFLVMEGQQSQGLPPALVGERTQELL